jgi:hypothetical protein
MTEFGDPETITVADLAPGDFVVQVPTQRGMRGFRVNSAVREMRDDHGSWTASTGYRRPRQSMRSRVIMWLDRTTAAVNLPLAFHVEVRRPAGAVAATTPEPAPACVEEPAPAAPVGDLVAKRSPAGWGRPVWRSRLAHPYQDQTMTYVMDHATSTTRDRRTIEAIQVTNSLAGQGHGWDLVVHGTPMGHYDRKTDAQADAEQLLDA